MSIQRIEVDGLATMQITDCVDKQLIGVMAVKLIKPKLIAIKQPRQ
jgi:hypothetical protein